MNIDVAEMGSNGRIDWGDLKKFKITFEPQDFLDAEPSKASSTLTCIGCTDESEQNWKLVEEATGVQFIVPGPMVYDALINRMIRINVAKKANVEKIASDGVKLARLVVKELGNSCLLGCQKVAEAAATFLKNVEITLPE